MILLTGAAGKTGQAILRALQNRHLPIRALVRKANQVQPLQHLGVQEVMVGNMRSPESMEKAVQGATALFHICPNVSPYEIQIGKGMIAAAESAQVGHVVYHSVLHPQIEAMPHHWKKMRVEEHLFASGLPFTILQPAPYMQNILAYWQTIVDESVYPVPYSEHARINLVDLSDLAEAAAIVLTEPGHKGATYELCGAENLSGLEISGELSKALGKRVEVQRIPLETWETNARKQGLGEYPIQTLIKMFRYYEDFGLIGNPRGLEGLLQCPATSFETFVGRKISKQSV